MAHGVELGRGSKSRSQRAGTEDNGLCQEFLGVRSGAEILSVARL